MSIAKIMVFGLTPPDPFVHVHVMVHCTCRINGGSEITLKEYMLSS